MSGGARICRDRFAAFGLRAPPCMVSLYGRVPAGGGASCCENAVAPSPRASGWRGGPGTPVFTPAPPHAAGRERVLPSSAMAYVTAPTPPGAARRPGSADLRSAPRGSAKPAPMTLRSGNLNSAPSSNPGCRDRSPLPLPPAAPFHARRPVREDPDHDGFSPRGPLPYPLPRDSARRVALTGRGRKSDSRTPSAKSSSKRWTSQSLS